MAEVSRRLAVLIDADNIPADFAADLLSKIKTIGSPKICRVYGDFSEGRLKQWSAAATRHELQRRKNPYLANGKNAADIALVVDAMDLLHRQKLDGFCIVSSDSDYTPLAQYLRKGRKKVIGFGRPHTPTAFQSACDDFFFVEELNPVAHPSSASQPPTAAVPKLRKAVEAKRDKKGWAYLSDVQQWLNVSAADFDLSIFGKTGLIDLVSKTGVFEIDNRDRVDPRIRFQPPQKKISGKQIIGQPPS